MKSAGFINTYAFVDYITKYMCLMSKNLIPIFLILSISLGSDTSRTVETYNNGNISSITYYVDSEEGLDLIKQEVFHFTGKKSMVGIFKDGLREGTWTFFYESGIKRLEGTYTSGQKDSLWTYWYDTGIKATEYFYDNKTIDGKIMEWHIDKECWDKDGNECECGDRWWSECETH